MGQRDIDTYEANRRFSDDMMPKMIEILYDNCARHFMSVGKASLTQDTKQSTDLIVFQPVSLGTIAARVRRPDCKYRDLTIRAQTRHGDRTEIDKMRDGWCRFYLYGWTDVVLDIIDWIFVDMDYVRMSQFFFETRPLISNGDGTKFCNYTIGELYKIGSLLGIGGSIVSTVKTYQLQPLLDFG